MPAAFDLVTIDTPQPVELATFWCAALTLHESEREDGGRWLVLSSDDGTRRLGLQRGSHRPGGCHLDLVCTPGEFDGEVARLAALGATPLAPPRREPYGHIVNMADPEGNRFDLCAYRHGGAAIT